MYLKYEEQRLRGILVDRNIEIFELEEQIKKLNIYKLMYFKKKKELERIKQLLVHLLDIANDSVYYEVSAILQEMEGTKHV